MKKQIYKLIALIFTGSILMACNSNTGENRNMDTVENFNDYPDTNRSNTDVNSTDTTAIDTISTGYGR